MFKVILILFLVTSPLLGKEKMDRYYNSSLGEKKIGNYHGPLDPDVKIESHSGETKLKDDVFLKHFGEDKIENSFFDLNSFWSSEVMEMNSCPNFYLDQNIEYIRYLYRLVTISYLFESIKEQATLAYRLGFSEDVCSLDWNVIFNKCDPKTGDMKRFLRRNKSRYLMSFDTRDLDVLKRGEKISWLKKELPSLLANTDQLTSLRLKKYCKSGSCKDFDQLKKAMTNSCQKDRYYINTICSEKDSLYGISWALEPTKLLVGSNVMRVLNKNGFAKACLERYGKLQKNKEVVYPHLSILFTPVYKDLVSQSTTAIEGELFLPGALKEFDDRGLEDFLFVRPKVIVKKEEPKVAPVIAKPKPMPKPAPVIAKKPIAKPKPLPKPIPLSTFEKTRKLLVDKQLKHNNLDMTSFKKDFVFNKSMIKALEAPLSDFQTREALRDMLSYDKLGSRFEPVRLLFLKFLIDQEKHVGLWNIISVLGSDFYVINDIEKKSQAVAVRLKNDDSTDNKWQITLIREDQIVKKKGAK